MFGDIGHGMSFISISNALYFALLIAYNMVSNEKTLVPVKMDFGTHFFRGRYIMLHGSFSMYTESYTMISSLCLNFDQDGISIKVVETQIWEGEKMFTYAIGRSCMAWSENSPSSEFQDEKCILYLVLSICLWDPQW
jgi:hypothetical protein